MTEDKIARGQRLRAAERKAHETLYGDADADAGLTVAEVEALLSVVADERARAHEAERQLAVTS